MTEFDPSGMVSEKLRRDWTILESERLADEFATLRQSVGVHNATIVWLFTETDAVGGANALPPWRFASTAMIAKADLQKQIDANKERTYAGQFASVGGNPSLSLPTKGDLFLVSLNPNEELPPWLEFVLSYGLSHDYYRHESPDWQFTSPHELWNDQAVISEAEYPPEIDGNALLGQVFAQVNCIGIERIRPRAFKLLRAFQKHLEFASEVGEKVSQVFHNVGVSETVGWIDPEDWLLAVASLAEHGIIPNHAKRGFAIAVELPFLEHQWAIHTEPRSPGNWEIREPRQLPSELHNGRPWFVMVVDDFVRACELACRWMADGWPIFFGLRHSKRRLRRKSWKKRQDLAAMGSKARLN